MKGLNNLLNDKVNRDNKFRVWDTVTESYAGGILWWLRADGKVTYGNAEWPEGILELNTEIPDIHGNNIFEGDILRFIDTNYGYGGEYDKIYDGYLYYVVPKIKYLLSPNAEDWVDFIYGAEIVGNIHQHENLLLVK